MKWLDFGQVANVDFGGIAESTDLSSANLHQRADLVIEFPPRDEADSARWIG